MANRIKFNAKQKKVFLEELAKDANVTRSARYVGVAARTAYDHKYRNAKFSEAWDAAVEHGIDAQIDECRRRAFLGVSDPIMHQGRLVGFKKKFSDTLAMFLIKAHRPEYRDKVDLGLQAGKGSFTLNVDIGPPPEDPGNEEKS